MGKEEERRGGGEGGNTGRGGRGGVEGEYSSILSLHTDINKDEGRSAFSVQCDLEERFQRDKENKYEDFAQRERKRERERERNNEQS